MCGECEPFLLATYNIQDFELQPFCILSESLFFEFLMVLPTSRSRGDGDSDDRLGVMVQGFKKRFTFKSAVKNVMKGLSLDEIVLGLEPFLRKVVREEVERAILPFLHPSSRPSLNQIEASRGRGLQLQFVKKLPSTIFTGSRIEAEDGNPIRIVLFDAGKNCTVSSGPLSSVKAEIVVLDGDFGADEQEDWTENEFNATVVRERDGKRPLVTGELNIILRDGVGTVGDIIFTDNSSWIRSRKFRLGARITQKISDEVTIREARSEAFVVKDHRGELYKKHYPPSSGDEIWRLERIAKDGAFHTRLSSQGIQTVKDFLRLYVTDQTALRNILGGGISNKTWETIIEHARTCVLDDQELYTYYGAAQRVGLLLDSIYKVIAATFDCQSYLPLDKLNLAQKLLVEDVKRQSYKNIHQLVLIDHRASIGPSGPLTTLQAGAFNGSSLSLQQLDFSVAHQGQPETQLTFNQSPPTSTSYTYEAEESHQSQVSPPQNGYPMQVFNPGLRNSFIMRDLFPHSYNGENIWSQGNFQASIMPSSHLTTEASDVQIPSWSPAWELGNNFSYGSNNESQYEIPFSNSKSKAGWCKVRAAFIWRSIGRDVAARRMARPLYIGY